LEIFVAYYFYSKKKPLSGYDTCFGIVTVLLRTQNRKK
jgi:hypothetical protein